MTFLQETNPLFILLFFVILYLLLYLFRRNIKDSLLLVAILFLSSLLLLPGGRAIADRTQYLQTPEERVRCLAGSVASGALWNGKIKIDSC